MAAIGSKEAEPSLDQDKVPSNKELVSSKNSAEQAITDEYVVPEGYQVDAVGNPWIEKSISPEFKRGIIKN